MIDKVQETHLYKWLCEKNSEFLGQVNEAIRYAETMLPLVSKVFADYTVHGIRHSINVMEYMFSLITDIDLLSDLEVVLLIYSALFHDIGMVTNENEINDIKSDNSVLGERKYSKVFEKYGEENISLQECIRPVHGKRSREHIENQMDEKLFLIPDSSVVSFRDELGLICMSHNEDFEWIEKELVNQSKKGHFEINSQYIAVLLRIAVSLCERFVDAKYLLPLKTSVINKIQTKDFSFSDLRLSLDYNAVTNLLMGEHIYGDKKYGLRELIQNSIDACKTMEESSLQMEEFRYQKYQPFISIVLDKDRRQVVIMDNGSGMSIEILKKYFLNVGVSYYASDDYLLQGRNYSPIGHYGIGFLACFMLSNRVEVKTVYYKDHKMNRISFEKNSEYICLTYENDSRQQGTEIILDYDQCMGVFENKVESLVSFVERNFLDSGIPIKISTMENGKPNTIEYVVKEIEQIIPDNICLNDYLDGVEAYIDCTYKQINFATHLRDLNGCDSYYYDGVTCSYLSTLSDALEKFLLPSE